MTDARSRRRILARLRSSGTGEAAVPRAPAPAAPALDREGRIARLSGLMTAVRTEVHVVAAESWTDKLREVAREKGWKRLAYGPGSPVGDAVEKAWPSGAEGLPDRVGYTEAAESFKETLFGVDAGITGTRAGVADTGAVVLWPTPEEPRLLSLVPPCHVAVLDAERIHDSLGAMMAAEKWAEGMPTNALLISGPSKTADIEFILVFGVHGPKELVLLIRT